MSTYLQLCQDLRRECGISGTGPTTVLNQSGELLRVVNWVAQAWTEIQNRKPNWRWMRSKFTVDTTGGSTQPPSVDAYAYTACTDTISSATITRFRHWLPTEFQIYLTSSGVSTSHWMTYEPWDAFKRIWKVGFRPPGYPAMVTIDPQNNFVLGASPNDTYTVIGDYQKSEQVLAADSDVPEMPSGFHQLIVYEAMKKYASYNAAPEVYARAKEEGSRMWRELEADQLPYPQFGEPLA